jgi:uncharacterized membrane protein YjgN (DUF898 family)
VNYLGPALGLGLLVAGIIAVGAGIDSAMHAKGTIAMLFNVTGRLLNLAGSVVLALLLVHKSAEFYFNNLVLEGQRCRYTGTFSGVFQALIGHYLLTLITCGIYGPWYLCKVIQYSYENTEVNGQRGRLSFQGDVGAFFGTYLLGLVLSVCTLYIYGAWFMNDFFAFTWENTRLDGRPFAFRKDAGSFLGQYILNLIFTVCTLGVFAPWMIANFTKWSTERVS